MNWKKGRKNRRKSDFCFASVSTLISKNVVDILKEGNHIFLKKCG
jgi:hypothetical protein